MINVFGYQIRVVFSVYINTKGKSDDKTKLLLINSKEKNHCVYIKVVNKLVHDIKTGKM